MNHSLTDNAYVNDILHQPDALEDTLSVFKGQCFDKFRQLADRLSSNSLNARGD
jgi:hypothetical protein